MRLRALPARERSEVEVQIMQVRDGTHWQSATGRCRLRVAGQLEDITRGDRLRVFAKFSRTRPALNPGQYNWAYAERGAGRYCEIFSGAPECISVIKPVAFSSVGI